MLYNFVMAKFVFYKKNKKHEVSGTAFQILVWRELRNIPFGKTISYAELAKRIGRPRAVRAVANACGANPLPVIVPCHRVIASDGTIGGYSGGLSKKKQLLKKEGIVLN
jgi:O-6-methylguanine DNA methyltransferase